MAETESGSGTRQRLAAPRNDRFGAALFALSEALAVFGGIVLIVMTAFTVISVVGRTGFDLPVLGDQEIVELGCAIGILSFMPYCQMRAANVIVDFFTARLMVLLTKPVFYPIVSSLDLGLTPDQVGVWFGILALMAVEMGMITPPFGLNIFVINAMADDVPMNHTFKGVLPFVVSDIVRLAIIVLVPATALYLPGMM